MNQQPVDNENRGKASGQLVARIKEGAVSEAFTALQNQLGGEIVGQQYRHKTEDVDITIERFHLGLATEMTIYDVYNKKSLLIEREKDDAPDFIHLSILVSGVFFQQIGDYKATMGHTSDVGMFLYNGLLDMNLEIPANVRYHSIGFKIDLSTLSEPYSEAQELLRAIFPEREVGVFYHHALSNEIIRLTSDLFHYSKLAKFKDLMVGSKGVEIFVHAISSFISLYEGNELSAFHKDDLGRLEGVKNDIMENIEHRYSLEELASKYNISASKLKRDFKKRYGIPVIQFANISRMEEAHRRLQKGEHSVSEVGYTLGYSNLSKFTSMFKKIIGIMPSEVEVLE